jgi:hypothetical protein
VKGGLSDSFKRAAVLWGLGRYLYEIEGVWVEIEQKGKSYAIKTTELSKLESAYMREIKRIFPERGKATDAPAKAEKPAKPATPPAPSAEDAQTALPAGVEYKIVSVKTGSKTSQMIELVDGNGEVTAAYVKSGDAAIVTGALLRKVSMMQKTGTYGEYNLINAYEVAA